MYSTLSLSVAQEPSRILFWSNILLLPDSINWKTVFQLKMCTIRDNRIKQFNFKLLHNVLPSKEKLYQWRILDTNKCIQCNEVETTFHLCYTVINKINWKIVNTN